MNRNLVIGDIVAFVTTKSYYSVPPIKEEGPSMLVLENPRVKWTPGTGEFLQVKVFNLHHRIITVFNYSPSELEQIRLFGELP